MSLLWMLGLWLRTWFTHRYPVCPVHEMRCDLVLGSICTHGEVHLNRLPLTEADLRFIQARRR